VHRNCTVHHIETLIDTDLFGDASCLLDSVRPSTKLGKAIAAAIADPNPSNIRTSMHARVDKWGAVGIGDLVLLRHDAGFLHGRIDALFDQQNRTVSDGPLAIIHLCVVTTDTPRSWKLKCSHDVRVVAVRDFSCSLTWTGDEDIVALKPEFVVHRMV